MQIFKFTFAKKTNKMKTINCRGKLINFDIPKIMAIVNLTPDSFYADSRCKNVEIAVNHIDKALQNGADMIDLGACSSRPGADEIGVDEEWQRLEPVLAEARRQFPEVIISIDTYRSKIAEMAVAAGAGIINDISCGYDAQMFSTIARLQVPYVLTHMRGTPATMQQFVDYKNVTSEVMSELSRKLRQLTNLGVHDVIIDPGFGFSKTLEQNYELFAHLSEFKIFDKPMLVGISRKSMIYKLLDITPDKALNGTTVLNTLALQAGAAILRVHDVAEAVEVRKIWGGIGE